MDHRPDVAELTSLRKRVSDLEENAKYILEKWILPENRVYMREGNGPIDYSDSLTVSIQKTLDNMVKLDPIEEAYGWLWAANEEPNLLGGLSHEEGAKKARYILGLLLNVEQRAHGIGLIREKLRVFNQAKAG